MLVCVGRISSFKNLNESTVAAGGDEMYDEISTAEIPENLKPEKKRCSYSLGVPGRSALILLAWIFAGCGLIQDNQAAQATHTAIALTATRTQSVAQTSTPTPGIGSTLISNVDGMEMLFVPEGTFLMGQNDEGIDKALEICNEYHGGCIRDWFAIIYPQHEVHLDSYWIDKTEVTNEMYAAFLNNQGNQREDGATWLYADAEAVHIEQANGTWQPDSGYANHPVVEVSWYGAAAYCDWAGRRLPTEAEWEKAAGGTEGQLYPWGNYDITGDLANYCDTNCNDSYDHKDNTENDGYAMTAPVGSYPDGSSPYGALDMAGNVKEWVSDWFDWYEYDEDSNDNSPVSNPTGPTTGDYRMLRGGSWYDHPSFLRSASRSMVFPDTSWYYGGFRCARSQ